MKAEMCCGRESKSDKLWWCNVYLKWGLHDGKSANHRILTMGGGGGMAKIVQDMTFKRFNKYPRYKSSWGRFIPRVESTPCKVKILQDYVLRSRFPAWRAANPEPEFLNLLRSSGIDSQPGGLVRQPCLMYWPARPHRLAESIPVLLKRLQIRALYNT